MVASTLIICVIVAVCIKTLDENLRSHWHAAVIFFQSTLLAVFVQEFNIHELFWLKLKSVNIFLYLSLTACIIKCLYEQVQSALCICTLVKKNNKKLNYLPEGIFYCFWIIFSTILFSNWLHTCLRYKRGLCKCKEEIRHVQGGD